MVKYAPIALVALLTLTLAISAATSVNAQNLAYTVDHEWAKIFINQDGTIDLTYNITVTVTLGVMHGYYVGQPKSDFTPGPGVDQYGTQLQVVDATSGSNYRVDVTLNPPLTAGNSVWFQFTTNVAGMIYNDTTIPDNLGMQFAPSWDTTVSIADVRVMIVFPSNVTRDMIRTGQVEGSVLNDPETGNWAVYWQKQSLGPNELYLLGVSFPQSALQYVPGSGTPPDNSFLDNLVVVLGIVGVIAGLIGVYAAYIITHKKPYQTPKVSMETLGIRRGLTAVEASYLLDLKPTQIVTEILYSLLQKRAVWAESTNPSLKLRILPPFQNKKGPENNPLRYYEIDFLEAIKADGTLDEEKLAKAVMFLRDTLEQKLKGYSRKDTVDYNRKIVDKAWTQVEQAGTDDLASKAYDEQLLWLLMDPNYRGRTQSAFSTRVFEPSPLWFWYWYGYTHYNPHPTYRPNLDVPTQSAKPPNIPGAEFANNIATSLEKTSGNIVSSIERFANAIIPAKPVTESHPPANRKADCVCACAACACACACVSCACACAGGGGH
jgi:hypothetical protein